MMSYPESGWGWDRVGEKVVGEKIPMGQRSAEGERRREQREKNKKQGG